MPTLPISTQQDFMDGSIVVWGPLTTANADGQPTRFLGTGDRCIQVSGTFGLAGTVIVEGSIDGQNWFQLRDPLSNFLSFSSAGLKAILEAVPFVRPRVLSGDGTTSLTAHLCVRRS